LEAIACILLRSKGTHAYATTQNSLHVIWTERGWGLLMLQL